MKTVRTSIVLAHPASYQWYYASDRLCGHFSYL